MWKLTVGQVIKFKNNYGDWQYERVFAIGECPKHRMLHYIRITDNGHVPSEKDILSGELDCGCLGEIKSGPLPLNKLEKGSEYV